MVAITQSKSEEQDSIIFMDPEEGRAQFDALARRLIGISGDEFIRRWDAGAYRDIDVTDENRRMLRLSMLIPLGRSNT